MADKNMKKKKKQILKLYYYALLRIKQAAYISSHHIPIGCLPSVSLHCLPLMDIHIERVHFSLLTMGEPVIE